MGARKEHCLVVWWGKYRAAVKAETKEKNMAVVTAVKLADVLVEELVERTAATKASKMVGWKVELMVLILVGVWVGRLVVAKVGEMAGHSAAMKVVGSAVWWESG